MASGEGERLYKDHEAAQGKAAKPDDADGDDDDKDD
jgi:hypothetical protein